MRTEHLDLRAQAVLRDAVVLVVPLGPFLPLVTAHPAEHQWDAQLVSHFHDVLAGKLALEADHIEAKILDVAQYGGVAGGVIGEQQVGCVCRAAHQKVLAVDRQIEIAALAELGELVVLIAVLRNGANAEPQLAGVGFAVVLPELQAKVVEVGFAERVGPPEVGVLDAQLREFVWGEADLALLAGRECNRLLDLDAGLVISCDCGPQNATDLLGRRIA